MSILARRSDLLLLTKLKSVDQITVNEISGRAVQLFDISNCSQSRPRVNQLVQRSTE